MTFALGGVITESGIYRIHTFNSSGTLQVIDAGKIQVLIVGGGGNGVKGLNADRQAGGGGGGGEVLELQINIAGGIHPVTVGLANQDSIFYSNTARHGYTPSRGPIGGNSGDGHTGANTTGNGGAGGGGGDNGNGVSGAYNAGGAGGVGTASSITGTSLWYGGGGGGCGVSAGAGGSGVGGNGAGTTGNGGNAMANRGSGGGGSWDIGGGDGGLGSAGVVIVRYIPGINGNDISDSEESMM